MRALDVSPLGSPAAVFAGSGINASRLAARLLSIGAARSHRPFARPQQQTPLSVRHSGVNVPGLKLRDVLALSFPRPFGPPAPQPLICPEGATPGSSTAAASTPQARCGFRSTVLQAASGDLHSPSGIFVSLRIKAFNRFRRLPARLTISPDRLSLPGTVSISSVGPGSPFLARYDSAG